MAALPLDLAIEFVLKRRGLASARELADELRVSQPTISRTLANLGSRVLRIGAARSTRYALTEPLRGHGARLPVHRVQPDGRVERLGELTTLVGEHFRFERNLDVDAPVFGEAHEVVIAGLPWFLIDARPQGFLGRTFAQRNARRLDVPSDLARWTDRHALLAMLEDGDDLPGNLILGDAMRERALASRLRTVDAIREDERGVGFDALADAAIAGEAVGSSAGGEHPKFVAVVRGEASSMDDAFRHVLVKFTEASRTPARMRWRDLLIAEHLAAEALREIGIDAVRSRLVEGPRRFHLEIERFDRVGEFGRRGVVSLLALDDVLDGERDDWPRSAARLERDGWITHEAARALRVLHHYGRLIANTDMHFGNASMFVEDRRPFALTPAYDMLPMLYRPGASGEIIERRYEPTPPPGEGRDEWSLACAAAVATWSRIASDARVSDDFRTIAADNGAMLERAREAWRA